MNFDDLTEFEDYSNAFSPQQMKAVMLLAAGNSNSKTAREAGVSFEVVNRWMQDPTFRLAVKTAISNMLGETLAKAVRETETSLDYLVSVRDNEEESTRNRMSATKEIINIAVNYGNVILDERLARIEQAMEAEQA